MQLELPSPRNRLAVMLVLATVLGGLVLTAPRLPPASAQDESSAPRTEAPTSAGQDPSADPPAVAAAASPTAASPPEKSIDIFSLAMAGGIFMIPIAAMSLLAASITIERALALRRSRVLPQGLVAGLGEMSGWAGGVDTQKALRLCQQFPSPAANVVRSLLVRLDRPPAELEAAAAAASQREADLLYANVRWLNMAASLSTMLGLIGTIQGMILAFHQLTTLDAVSDRTTMLAAGIYTALITTFSGLAVAIPALFAAHYFESRILRLFHQIDSLTEELLPRLVPADRRPLDHSEPLPEAGVHRPLSRVHPVATARPARG